MAHYKILSDDEIRSALASLPDWSVNAPNIEATFTLKNLSRRDRLHRRGGDRGRGDEPSPRVQELLQHRLILLLHPRRGHEDHRSRHRDREEDQRARQALRGDALILLHAGLSYSQMPKAGRYLAAPLQGKVARRASKDDRLRRAMAPDGAWPAAVTLVGLHDRRTEPSSSHPCFPHPIRPSGPPSALREEGGAPRRGGPSHDYPLQFRRPDRHRHRRRRGDRLRHRPRLRPRQARTSPSPAERAIRSRAPRR